MHYDISFFLLNEKEEVVDSYEHQACFSKICGSYNVDKFKGVKYLKYDFSNYDQKNLTKKQIYKYLLFIKNIPELTHLLPYDVYQMAQDCHVTYDVTKVNGLQLFSILTIIRAVREDANIVKQVLDFNPEKEYSLSKLGILKAAGALHHTNSGHWLTAQVNIGNLNKSPADNIDWNDNTPTNKTGLVQKVNATWQCPADGYAVKNPVTREYLYNVLAENIEKKEEPPKKKRTVKKKTALNLEFA